VKLYLVKNSFGGLQGSDGESSRSLSDIAVGEVVQCEIKRPRNLRFHRMFFAVLHKAHENLPEDLALKYPSIDSLLIAVKIGIGMLDLFETPNGKVYPLVKSISFESMDEDEFHRFYRDAVSYLCGILNCDEYDLIEAASGKFS